MEIESILYTYSFECKTYFPPSLPSTFLASFLSESPIKNPSAGLRKAAQYRSKLEAAA